VAAGDRHRIAPLGLAGLRWDDVDPVVATVNLRRLVVDVAGELVVAGPKRASGRRTIRLDAGTVTALKGQRSLQAPERLAARPTWPGSGVVSIIEDSRSVLSSHMSRVFVGRVAEAGLPPIRFDDAATLTAPYWLIDRNLLPCH
jgi:hypothetical protein